MSRNVFENNSRGLSEEDAEKLADKVHSLLPPLAEGYHYELVVVSSGTAVVVEKN